MNGDKQQREALQSIPPLRLAGAPQSSTSAGTSNAAVAQSLGAGPRSYFGDLLREIQVYRLKGTETASLFTLLSALELGLAGVGGQRIAGGFGKGLSVFNKYVEELAPLTPSQTPFSDLGSLALGASLAEFTASPAFRKLLKNEKLTLFFLILLAQSGYSAVRGLVPDTDPKGTLIPSLPSKHLQLLLALARLSLGESLKPPDAFGESRIGIGTDPRFAADFLGGPPPSGLTFEHFTGMGEPGGRTTFNATLNLAKLIVPRLDPKLRPKDIGDLARYRGSQATVWGAVDAIDPTPTARREGQRPELKFKVGGIAGVNGLMFLGEGGARAPGSTIVGEKAAKVSMFCLQGGWSRTLPEEVGAVRAPKRFGFKATLFKWTAEDIDATAGPDGKKTGGQTVRLTPFFDVRVGTGQHQLGFGAALSFLTGLDPSNVSEVRGNVSYRYLGEGGPDRLPVFLLDLTGSFHRFVPWDPRSAGVWGAQGQLRYRMFYAGFKVEGTLQQLPESRLRALDPELLTYPRTSFVGTGGIMLPWPSR